MNDLVFLKCLVSLFCFKVGFKLFTKWLHVACVSGLAQCGSKAVARWLQVDFKVGGKVGFYVNVLV